MPKNLRIGNITHRRQTCDGYFSNSLWPISYLWFKIHGLKLHGPWQCKFLNRVQKNLRCTNLCSENLKRHGFLMILPLPCNSSCTNFEQHEFFYSWGFLVWPLHEGMEGFSSPFWSLRAFLKDLFHSMQSQRNVLLYISLGLHKVIFNPPGLWLSIFVTPY